MSEVVLDEQVAQSLMLVEVGGTRHSTRKNEQVGIGKFTLGKYLVCLDNHVVGALDKLAACDAHCYYFNSCSTEYVNWCHGLNFLKAICKKYINLCHSI